MKISFYKITVACTTLLMSVFVASAQDEGFIYGKVFTEDGRAYEGAIRWGKEEVYWTDMFNASKERNENLRFLSDRDREKLDDRHMEWYSWEDRFSNWVGTKYWNGNSSDQDYIHQFSCQFGEITSITPIGKSYAEIELRNGQKFEVNGEGYNDIGLDIRIIDKELGEVDVYWNRIEKVQFMATPSRLEPKFGQPMFGTVEAFGDKFTGYIQWDHDERLSTDKLDGDSDDGDVSIEFGKIRSIERKGNQSLVTLRSGRELWLDGSNDVSSGHRGVIVMNKDFPSIDIPWKEFDKVTFEEKPVAAALSTYGDFKTQAELDGTVTTHSGKSFSGKLIYDLDEAYNFELLQGKEGDFEFAAAFRDVKKIITNGTHRCTIELRNGKRISLDDGQDVDQRNQGVLIFAAGKDDPSYIPWDDVSEIEFR